jgi:hypothetical protein
MKTIASIAAAVLVLGSLALACGECKTANVVNSELAEPADVNQSPTQGDGGGPTELNKDLSKPATVNQSPNPSK